MFRRLLRHLIARALVAAGIVGLAAGPLGGPCVPVPGAPGACCACCSGAKAAPRGPCGCKAFKSQADQQVATTKLAPVGLLSVVAAKERAAPRDFRPQLAARAADGRCAPRLERPSSCFAQAPPALA